jgi:MFS family permease
MDPSAGALTRLRTARARRPALSSFIGVFAATLLGFLAVGGVLPVLPRYVHGPIGAGDLAVGIVIGAFAFTAVIARPVGGRLADARGRRMVVVAGLLTCAAAGLLYMLPFGVPGLVFARLVLGVGDGWVFTAGATWIVDLAPERRRGQAIGLFGLAIWGGLSAGPILGQLILDQAGYDWVFAFAAITPLLGALVARRVADSPMVPAPRVHGESLVPRAVVAPGVALALANVGYGTVAGFVVLHLSHRGVGHGATVFTAFAASVVVTRLVAGRLPDTLGPLRSAAASGCAEALGLALLAAAHSLPVALAGGIVMGWGFSLLFPSLALVAMRTIPEQRRGAALGIFTAFFDVGFGLGAPIAGAVASLAGYPAAFWMSSAAAAAGVLTVALAVRGGDVARGGGDVARGCAGAGADVAWPSA